MTDEKQNYFDLLPNELIEKIFIETDPNVKLELVSKRFNIIANSDYVINNRFSCICLKHYYHFELAGEFCKAKKHKCVCNLGFPSSVKYCRAKEHPCVCNQNPHIQKECRSETHPCTCDNIIPDSIIECRFEGTHKCSCELFPHLCRIHTNN